MTKTRIGIFGGSFNPVHYGHINLARHIAASDLVDEVWLVLSPANPLKHSDMASELHRLDMLKLAVNGVKGLQACDIELHMPRPSYTINTLDRLSQLHPDKLFTLITGADNLAIFDHWRDHRRIIDEYGLIVYPRPAFNIKLNSIDNKIRTLPDVPLYDISSTQIRQAIADGTDVNNLLPTSVYQYIQQHQLYR